MIFCVTDDVEWSYFITRVALCLDKENCKVPRKKGFNCATIAYHVGLYAVLGWLQGIRPTSKKNRHLLLAVASS